MKSSVVIVVSFFLFAVSACTLVEGRDYRIDRTRRAIIARDEIVSANICLQRHVIITPQNLGYVPAASVISTTQSDGRIRSEIFFV